MMTILLCSDSDVYALQQQDRSALFVQFPINGLGPKIYNISHSRPSLEFEWWHPRLEGFE
jgi:hypothetical protein